MPNPTYTLMLLNRARKPGLTAGTVLVDSKDLFYSIILYSILPRENQCRHGENLQTPVRNVPSRVKSRTFVLFVTGYTIHPLSAPQAVFQKTYANI